MVQAFIAIGSNLGDRSKNFEEAARLLNATRGIRVVKKSPVYETEPIGGPPQGKYLNAVWEIETDLSAKDLLQALRQVESQLGRVREGRNFPRTLDLDILFYGNEMIQEKDLIIPHPRLQERLFVLNPFSDIAPEKIHPALKKSVRVLKEEALERN